MPSSSAGVIVFMSVLSAAWTRGVETATESKIRAKNEQTELRRQDQDMR